MEKYRPSNGTEGDSFQAQFCERCKFYDDCDILLATMFLDLDDPEYPEEWTYDAEDNPICTAFELDPAAQDG